MELPKIAKLPERFKSIKTTDDVRMFYRHLTEVEGVIFHPDDSFDGYGNRDGNTYTPEEAKERDAAMDQCHEVCRAIDAAAGIPKPDRGNSDLVYTLAIEEDDKLQKEE